MDMFMLVTTVSLILFLTFSMNLVSESQNELDKEEKTYKDKLKKRQKKIEEDTDSY